ncbi:hypothetical protein H5410_051948, partial [Solanum commersonii]
DKLQSDPKYKVKEMKANLQRFDIVIDLSKQALSNGKRKFLRMYICFKAMKLGFKSGLRPLIGLDGTFLKGKTKGQVLCAVGQDSNNSSYPLAWDMGLLEAVRTVLPKAHQRYPARHIEANWCKRWGKEFEDQLQEIKEVNGEAGQDLIDKYPPKAWCRAYLDTVCKNQVVHNNFTESFNAWILEARYKPIIGMLEDIRVKIIERLVAKEISKVCKVSGNGDNGYKVTEDTDRHIVNLREKKCTCRTWDLTEIPCPHAIKSMAHKKMIPKKEIHWYYSKEAALAVYKHKLQPVRGEPFWKCDPLHAIEPPELVKLAKQGKQPTKKQGKQPTKQGKESGRGKKRQLRRGLVDEDEASEEDINCTAPQPTQESQFEYASSSSYFLVAEDDDEDPRLRPRTISEEAFLRRLRKKQSPQSIGSRIISFRGDKFGVSELTNIPIEPTGLTWNGQGAVTTNQLQKLRPRRG